MDMLQSSLPALQPATASLVSLLQSDEPPYAQNKRFKRSNTTSAAAPSFQVSDLFSGLLDETDAAEFPTIEWSFDQDISTSSMSSSSSPVNKKHLWLCHKGGQVV